MNQATNRPRKILYLITKATHGGAQKYVFDLATHLPTDAFHAIVAFGEKGKLTDALQQSGMRTVQLPSLGRDIALLSDISSFFQILSCIRRERPDVVHLNSSKAAGLGALAARMCGIKDIVFTVHGWPSGERRNVFSKVLIWKLSWLTALLAHRVICVSEYDLTVARHMPLIGKKAVRIYNGIDLGMHFGSGERIRNAFPPGARITGTIGELNRNKNQSALIEEAKEHPEMSVAIVGEGEERKRLEKKIAFYGLGERVKLFGFMSAAEVLKGFDTFALPSVKEGLPYVLLEARVAGVPITANRVGGVGEILDAKDLSEFSLEHMVAKTIVLYLPAQAD